jgi:hypothetical protein
VVLGTCKETPFKHRAPLRGFGFFITMKDMEGMEVGRQINVGSVMGFVEYGIIQMEQD